MVSIVIKGLQKKKKKTDPKVKKVAQSPALEAMSKAILANCTEESTKLKVAKLEEKVKSEENNRTAAKTIGGQEVLWWPRNHR